MKNIFVLIALFISLTLQAQEIYSIADIPLELIKNSNSILLDEKVDVDISNFSKLEYGYYAARAAFSKRGV